MDQAPIDLLLVLAQIGVTAAGFCPLASVVGQTLSTAHPEVNAIRLRGLLKVPVLGTESARRGASHRWAPASSRRWSAMECSSPSPPASSLEQ